MSDLTPLRELTTSVVPPALEELDRVVTHRQRRRTGALAAAVAALVVAVTFTGTTLLRNDSAPDLIAPDPTSASPSPTSASPSPSETTGSALLTPEEIRNHPDATRQRVTLMGLAAGFPAGVAARIWSVCTARRCGTFPETPPRRQFQRAIEVTADDFATSALFPVTAASEPSWVIDDWFLVDQTAGRALVNASGEERPLTLGDPVPVADLCGPPIFDGSAGLACIDLASGRWHPLRAEGGLWEWQPASTMGAGTDLVWFWGPIWFVTHDLQITRQGVLWRNPDGTFGVRLFDFTFAGHTTQALLSDTPGTMAVVDQGPPRIIHGSTDYGFTWQAKLHPGDLRTGPGASQLPEDWESLPDAP